MMDTYPISSYYRRTERESASIAEQALDRSKDVARSVGHGVKRAAPYAALAVGGLAVLTIGTLLFAPPAKKVRKNVMGKARDLAREGKQLTGAALNKVEDF